MNDVTKSPTARDEEQKWILSKSGLSDPTQLLKLTKLNLPNCGLSSLPSSLSMLVPNLSILFCPKNQFKELPVVVGDCPNLQMISFKDNGMESIHPDALQPQLRWLILTGNQISQLPETIGRCVKMQKLMLSGNSLKALPDSICNMKNLELIRLACNQLLEPPMTLLDLPNLRWVAFSGNPFLRAASPAQVKGLVVLPAPILEDPSNPILGQGAGGITRKVQWNGIPVAVKTYAGEMTSDGSPQDEKAVNVVAASVDCPSLIKLHGQTLSGALVMEFLEGFDALAGPPSMESCSRDEYADSFLISESFAWEISMSLLLTLAKIHEKGVCHGDFYGHNILVSSSEVKLSDFGAAFFYDVASKYGEKVSRIELRAYNVLVEELRSKMEGDGNSQRWKRLIDECGRPEATFAMLTESFDLTN